MGGIEAALYCIIISVLWGATNPLIKSSTQEFVTSHKSNHLLKLISEFKCLISNWRCIIFFLINQGGSVLYFIVLQNVDLSLIIPAVNALTFLVTGFVGVFTSDSIPTSGTVCGLLLILLGITFCVLDKIYLKPL